MIVRMYVHICISFMYVCMYVCMYRKLAKVCVKNVPFLNVDVKKLTLRG